MPLVDRTLANDEQDHLDDHNGPIQEVVNNFEGTTPAAFAPAAHSHTASQIAFGNGGTIASTDVQFAVHEVANDAAAALAAHTGDTSDAHDASAVSVLATGGVSENNVQDAITNLDQRITAIVVSVSGEPGVVTLASMSGATNEDKLTTFLNTYAPSALSSPTLDLGVGPNTWTTKGRTPFEGMKIKAPGFPAAQEAVGTATGRANEQRLNFESSLDGVGWFHGTNTSQVRSLSFSGLNLKAVGSTKPAFLTASSDSVNWWVCSATNITSDSLWGVIGTFQQRLALTGCHFTGPGWNLNNGYSTTIHVAGSDCVFFPDGCFLDSPPARHPATGAARYHFWLDFMDKSYIGPMFITAEEKWGACLISGPNYNAGTVTNNGGPLTFYGTRFEGRNIGQASYGSTYRMDGGIATHYGSWFAYGMEDTATAARSPLDAGVCHVYGGAHLRLFGPTYDRATLAAESVPFIYASGADTIVRPLEVAHGTKGGTWSGLPRVQAAASAQVKASDGTYTVI